MAGAVQRGRLLELHRQPAKEVEQDQNVPDGNAGRQDQRPDRVDQSELPDDHVSGYQPAGKQHREEHDPHVERSTRELSGFLGERICREDGEDHVHRYAQTEPLDGDQHRLPVVPPVDHGLVRRERESDRKEAHPAGRGQIALAERDRQNVYERQDAEERERQQEQAVCHREDLDPARPCGIHELVRRSGSSRTDTRDSRTRR